MSIHVPHLRVGGECLPKQVKGLPPAAAMADAPHVDSQGDEADTHWGCHDFVTRSLS